MFVAGLKEEIVSNGEQVLKLIEGGEGLKHNSLVALVFKTLFW